MSCEAVPAQLAHRRHSRSPLPDATKCRRPFDEGSQQQSATETLIWQRMLPLMHRL